MKDSHIYTRMNNPKIMAGYLRMINTEDLDIVRVLYKNIAKEADDHPKFAKLREAFEARVRDHKE